MDAAGTMEFTMMGMEGTIVETAVGGLVVTEVEVAIVGGGAVVVAVAVDKATTETLTKVEAGVSLQKTLAVVAVAKMEEVSAVATAEKALARVKTSV